MGLPISPKPPNTPRPCSGVDASGGPEDAEVIAAIVVAGGADGEGAAAVVAVALGVADFADLVELGHGLDLLGGLDVGDDDGGGDEAVVIAAVAELSESVADGEAEGVRATLASAGGSRTECAAGREGGGAWS